jgi:hypothetical protein
VENISGNSTSSDATEIVPADATTARSAGAEPGPQQVDLGRRRLDLALVSAGPPSPDVAQRRGIPGLRNELFPAAAWRRELDALDRAEIDRSSRRILREEARVTHSLADVRAEDILRTAREQARRLVGTAAAVAKARREQAERAAATALATAEQAAAETLAAAEQQARDLVAESGADAGVINDRLLKLRTALQAAEAKLGAFSATTRQALVAQGDVIDLDAEEFRGDIEREEALANDLLQEVVRHELGGGSDETEEASITVYEPDETDVVPVPRIRPKGRFTVPGLTPDRIERLRDELTP